MEEKVIEHRNCKKCDTHFHITDKDLEFYKQVSPNFWWKTYNIPSPNLCPRCRQQRRLSWRNERHLYKRECDSSKKPIISMYSPDKPFPVYEREIWFSDIYEPCDYGKDFDFSRGFFEQFTELMNAVPKFSIQQQPPMENSAYCNYASNCRDSYLLFDSDYNEACIYGNVVKHSNHCVDCSIVHNSESCYDCVDLKECFGMQFSNNCINCSNGYYVKDSIASHNCFASINLQNANYCIFNKKYTKDEYEQKVIELMQDPNLLSKIESFYNDQPHKATFNYLGENVSWNHINDSKDTRESFDISNWENVKYCDFIYSGKNIYDVSSFGEHISEVYDSTTVWINSSRVYFSAWVAVDSDNVYYSYLTFPNVKNAFGCIGLKNKQYCILNKQYSQEEYEALVPKIIEHMQKNWEWGEFFPASLSPFGYNETVANEYFPLTQQASEEGWFNWSDYQAPFPKVEKIIPASKLPKKIEDIPDDILNWAIECEVTKKPFRIIKAELDFYRKRKIPIPKRHPDQRHLDRMKLRNPRELFERNCDKCEKNIQSVYANNRSETVYCEECYNKEVY